MMKDSVVVKTRIEDLDEAIRIYDFARVRMTEGGNPNQWTDGYPSRDVIAEDIESGNSYKIVIDGRIAGVFTFIIGDDPTYEVIEGGWLNDNPYGAIHRIAAVKNISPPSFGKNI